VEESVDSTTRFIVGLLLLLAAQILLGGSMAFLARRWKQSVPATKKVSGTLHLVQETWRPRKPKVPDTFFVHRWAFSLLGLLVTGIGLLPVIGRFAAVIVSLFGLKRLSGLDILSTFIFRSAWGFRCSYLRPCSAASCKWTCSVCGNEPSSLTSVAAVDRE
jgi:hypothetical protein